MRPCRAGAPLTRRLAAIVTRPCRAQDDLLNLFYDEFVHKLAGPIAGKLHGGTAPLNGEVDGGAGGEAGELDVECDGVLSTQQHVCELLCFCVQARAAPHPHPPPPPQWSAEEQTKRLKDSEPG